MSTPIPVKQAMNNMGFEVGKCRLPLCDMDAAAAEQLLACMARYGLAQPGKRIGTVTVKRAPDTLLWRKNTEILHPNGILTSAPES